MQTHTKGLPFPKLPSSPCCSVTALGCLSVRADAEQGWHKPWGTQIHKCPHSQPDYPSKLHGTQQAGRDQSGVWSRQVLHLPSYPCSTTLDCRRSWSDKVVAALPLSGDVIWMVALQALDYAQGKQPMGIRRGLPLVCQCYRSFCCMRSIPVVWVHAYFMLPSW